jgi:hypothetical protein
MFTLMKHQTLVDNVVYMTKISIITNNGKKMVLIKVKTN